MKCENETRGEAMTLDYGRSCKALGKDSWRSVSADSAEKILDDLLAAIRSEFAYGGSDSHESDFTYLPTIEWLPLKKRIQALKEKP